MIFQNSQLVQKQLNTKIGHRDATTGLDRKSTFYDRTLAQEFKNHFVFIRPKEVEEKYRKYFNYNDDNEKEQGAKTIKKRYQK